MAKGARRGAMEGAIETGKQGGLRLPWGGPPPSLGYVLGAGLAVLAGFAVAFAFVEPPPPTRLAIAAGPSSGAYHAYATRYAEILEREGVELAVLETAGSVDNLARLADGAAEVALLQGGVVEPAQAPDLRSLAGLYYEPLWLFHRGEQDRAALLRFAGRRIAVGPEGSGTRALAERLLLANGMGRGIVQRSPLGGEAAAAALLDNQVDAAMLVGSPDVAAVRRLLDTPGIRLMSFARADGYAQRFRFLSVVTLHEGAVDLAREYPVQDVRLIAPVANLVAGPALHPALVALLLQAAREVHGAGGLFERPGAFPSTANLSFPLHREARRFFERGPPLLQRYLPFGIASFLERMVILLIPLATLLIPLARALPPVYRWRVRARINRWYRELAMVELARAEGRVAPAAAAADIDRIEAEVARLRVPLGYANELYALRLHIDYIRGRRPA